MKRKIAGLEKVDANLVNLQHKIRRDPPSYREDFIGQYSQLKALLEIFFQTPNLRDDAGIVRLRDLVDFVAHVADCYATITTDFPKDLTRLLDLHHASLYPELRDKIVTSLVLLRKKDILSSITLINTFFPILIASSSKTLRELLFEKIVFDLRNANAKTTNHKLNRQVQTACYNLIESDPTSKKGMWSIKLTREMWKRRVWTDARAVSIMELAAFAQDSKLVTSAVRFFLGADDERMEDVEDTIADDVEPDLRKLRHQTDINKKSGKRNKELKYAMQKAKRMEKRKKAPPPLNFGALHLLSDPQTFAEKLFQLHLQPAQPQVRLILQHKLLVLQLVSRLVGLHKLTLLPLYSYFTKFLHPRQQSVTSFLAALAQASHSLVPPDALEPLILKIANEFITEAAATEIASAGLNAIREICFRQPLAMSATLLQDLVLYRKSKDKGVQMAANGLQSLFRDVDPALLRKRDRGRDAALGLRDGERPTPRFGQVESSGRIDGLELLEAWKQEQGSPDDPAADDEDGWKNWDAQSDDSESSGGWINVESDGDAIDVSASDDDRPAVSAAQPSARDFGKRKHADAAPPAEHGERTAGEGAEPDATAPDDLPPTSISTLATSRILTPADLAKLHELRARAAVAAHLPVAKRRKLEHPAAAAASTARHADDAVTAEQISGLGRYGVKATKEERVRMAKGDAAGDDKHDHRSKTARRKERKVAEGKSTTNKEKERKKNLIMTLGKAKRKGKRGLNEHRKILKMNQSMQRGKKARK